MTRPLSPTRRRRVRRVVRMVAGMAVLAVVAVSLGFGLGLARPRRDAQGRPMDGRG